MHARSRRVWVLGWLGLLLFATPPAANAAVPQLVAYQGRVTVSGTNFSGTARFKFALVDGGGVSRWSNDGMHPPLAAVSLPVEHGRFAVRLGDTSLASMSALAPALFATYPTLRLRVWFNDDVHGFQQLSPDQPIASVGYALLADTVADGAVTASKIGAGAVGSSHVADNSLTANDLAASSVAGSELADNAVGATELQADAVNSAKVLDNSLTAADLATDSVGSIEIATDAVGSDEIAANAVGTSEVVDNSLTAADLAAGAVASSEVLDNSLTANDLGAASVTASELAIGSVFAGALQSGSVTADAIAANAVGASQIAADAVGSSELADNIDLGTSAAYGSLDLFRCAFATSKAAVSLGGLDNTAIVRNDYGADAVRLEVSNHGGRIGVYDTNNVAKIQLYGVDAASGGGVLYVDDADGTGTIVLQGAEHAATGARITLRTASGGNRVFLDGDENGGGALFLQDADGTIGIALLGAEHSTKGGRMDLYAADGSTGITLLGENAGGDGEIRLMDEATRTTVALSGDQNGGGSIFLSKDTGVQTVLIDAAQTAAGGGRIRLRSEAGNTRLYLDGDDGNSDGGYIACVNSNGSSTVQIYGDYYGTGDGRVVTDELQITGGSDLSEQFNIRGPVEPGVLVCIDPAHPGDLRMSSEAYAATVAGIVSGANGIKPGMLMGQRGTAADGLHAVALTGRVYVKATVANGAIRPGDLLTTSEVPGHAMKATDPSRAFGAVIGKAMTALDEGRGLVLVLVQPR